MLAIVCAACRPAPRTGGSAPTVIPFPTMTAGVAIAAALPPPDDEARLANPATAIALANPPTATPNYRACPAPNADARVADIIPATGRDVENALTTFLNAGGTLINLERGVRESWGIAGNSGTVRGDLDLTGEGIPEAIVTLVAPDAGGLLLIFGCVDSRYRALYSGSPDGTQRFNDAPQLVRADDLNRDRLPDLVFSARACAGEDGASLNESDCTYTTQMATWNAPRGRMTNLLASAVVSEAAPTLDDVDQDSVLELLVRLDNPGDAQTGPLRTGFLIYDWDGVVYTQSITQLNPPRFRIQVIHDADAAFAAGRTSDAIALYDLSLNSPSLEAWRGGDENPVLQTYALYRLLLAFAYTNDERLVPTVQAILTAYPDPAAAPVYATLATAFWNAYQITNNLNAACATVKDSIAVLPDALSLLNRYGSRNPTYTADDLCPF
ncbi:MAG: hypothetical protein SGI73_02150 [Chloroflexota bacterium]|nr:hypothetical protein [Chloroflexota bacterium]